MEYVLIASDRHGTKTTCYISGTDYVDARDWLESKGYDQVQTALMGRDPEDADVQVVYYKKEVE